MMSDVKESLFKMNSPFLQYILPFKTVIKDNFNDKYKDSINTKSYLLKLIIRGQKS